MCSRFLRYTALLLVFVPITAGAADLRVCADPDALPSSNRRMQGYDNKIAELVARNLHATLVYEWQRNGRGFVRDVLNKGKCDVVLGVPTDVRAMLTTVPYYRSTYVFVSRRDRGLDLHTFRVLERVQVLSEIGRASCRERV